MKEKKKIDDKIAAMQGEIDSLFKDSEKRVLANYNLNLATNVIIIIFGVILLSLSIYFGFSSDEFTPFAGVAAAGGVANFIALFFSNPQTRLRRLIGDLVQMRMINANWVAESNIAFVQIKIDNYKLDTVIKVQEAISKITRAAVEDIEDYIGSDSNSAGGSSTQGTSGGSNGDNGDNGGNGGNGSGGTGASTGGSSAQQQTRGKKYTSDGKLVGK